MRSSLLVILFFLCTMSQPAHATDFGFNYWPRGFSADIFFDKNWAAHRADVEHDLDVIQSLGGTTLRLMFWPEQSGFGLDSKADSMTPEYRELTKNFPDFLSMLSRRHMKVIPCFSNSFLLYGPADQPKLKWWNLKYGGPEKLAGFLTDSGRWIAGIAEASEHSPYASAVLYYDIQNEYNPTWENMDAYVTAMSHVSAIPKSKLGISILYGASDVGTLRALATQIGATFHFVDFHIYPDANGGPGFNMDLESVNTRLKDAFPGSVILIGELGYAAKEKSDEAAQSSAMMSILQRAEASNIPYVLGWTIYDNSGRANMPMGNGMGVFDSNGQPREVAIALKNRADQISK